VSGTEGEFLGKKGEKKVREGRRKGIVYIKEDVQNPDSREKDNEYYRLFGGGCCGGWEH